jgi:hypothetical protein
MHREPLPEEKAEPNLQSARVFVVFSVRDTKRPNSKPSDGDSSATSFLERTLDHERFNDFANGMLVNESRRLTGSLWERVPDGGLRASEDLSPPVLRALGGTPHGEALSEGVPGIRLTAKGIHMLNGGYAPPSGNPQEWSASDRDTYRPKLSGLSLKLSSAAVRRLGSPGRTGAFEELFLAIEQLFVIFPSQYCILIAELTISTGAPGILSPLIVEEVLHALSKRGKTAECSLAVLNSGPRFDLHDLLKATVPRPRFEIDDRYRIFHYAALVLDTFPDDASLIEALAYRCARHYTLDYAIEKQEVGRSIYRPFESVIHAFGLEGAASVANGSDAFLSEQFITRVRQVYLWLVVLAYHEQSHLLGLINRQNFVAGDTDHRAKRFRALIDDFLAFRLQHRMPLVSHIEMHNQAYYALRGNLRLDELIQKVTQDIVEAERWLTQQIEHRRGEEDRRRNMEREHRKAWRHKFAPLEIFVSAFLMFGLTYLSFDALTHRFAMLRWNSDLPHPWNFLAPILVALAAAALRGWQVRSEIYEDPIFDLEQEATSTGEASEIESILGVAGGKSAH